MISRTHRYSRHALAAILVAGLATASCGSDSESSESSDSAPVTASATETDPPATEASDPVSSEAPPASDPDEPAATDPDEPAASDPDEPAATDPDEPAATDPDESAASSGGAFGGELFPAEAVDDVPVCEAYASFFGRFVTIAFAGSFAEAGGEFEEAIDGEETEGDAAEADAPAAETPDDEPVPELIEVVLYLDVADDAQILLDELPESLGAALDPVLQRAVAVPGIMSDAGFTDAEIDQLIEASATDGGLEGIEDDDSRFMAAADAMIAEFGPFLDTLDALETTDAASEADGMAFLESTCPKLSELTAESGI